jgi:hypothetical protein
MMSVRRVPLLALLRCATALLGPSTAGRPRLDSAAARLQPRPRLPAPIRPSDRRDSMNALKPPGWLDRPARASARLAEPAEKGGKRGFQ